jgi:hypothetical protein
MPTGRADPVFVEQIRVLRSGKVLLWVRRRTLSRGDLTPACYSKPMKRARKKITPRKETQEKMRPIPRDAFAAIVTRAIKTSPTKPVRKST